MRRARGFTLIELLIVVALTVTMFTNVKFIHPVRTRRWRANLWIDGWDAYAERDMQLHRIRIGKTVMELEA